MASSTFNDVIVAGPNVMISSSIQTAGMRKFRIDQDFLIEHWHMIYIMSVVFVDFYV